MPIGIEGKRIIVTGGGRGIGAAAVRAFAREGAKVASLDRLEDEGRAVARQASEAGPGSVAFFKADVSDADQVKRAVADSIAYLGGLDAVFNIAGIERASPIETMAADELDQIFDVNVKGVIYMCQAVFPHLRDHGGAIVNFASGAGIAPYPNGAHYSASKGAVISFSRTAAYEWGKYGIRVNSLNPAIWTPMYDEHRSRLSKEELAAHETFMAERIPLGGKLGDPDADLAPVLVFLASDASKFITAQILSVDGGIGPTR
jgi:NAD(P)-dependent dehydrogenase (short-subunit alcohol dehydrogenase family)